MSASNSAAPEPTEIDGRYMVEKKLGAGAFGTVYKARDKELGRLVAIKTIRLEGLAASTSSLDDLLKRFKQEAKVAAALRHPNIVALWDWRNLEGFAYISMEFVDGVGLDRVIAKSGKMSIERAAAIGAQVADALGYAHKNGVVHRDIKPANIMIEPGDHVKVTDFGIAKMTDSAEHLTVTGSLLGTPSYMSPEQARGGAVDGRSDLFSVGCILYEMLAGQKAFRGDSITALLFKIITEEPPSLRELDPTVTDEMLRIIGKALSKAPETRYQSGRELADDLLAVTRPGFVPTLRATDVPTLPPDSPPGSVPTIASPPTARVPGGTISSVVTTLRPAASSSTQPPAGAPPPLAPTVLTPPTTPPPLPPKPAPAAVRAPQPLVAPSPARKGGGAGLLVGLAIAAVLAIAVVAGGGWYLFSRKAATTEPSPAPDVARTAETPTPSEAAPPTPGAGAPAEAVPTPGAPPSSSLPAVTEPHPGGPRVASRNGPPAPPAQPPAASKAPESSLPAGAAGGGDYAFLDEAPTETPDGRAAGEELAQKYRAGGSGGYSGTRFSARPRWPRGLTRPEGPAVRTLLHIHSAEEAYHRKTGRYGNLREIADASGFGLDVPFRAEGFQRARYAFRVTVEGDGYRVEASPLSPIGRAFVVDDSGFVRLRDE